MRAHVVAAALLLSATPALAQEARWNAWLRCDAMEGHGGVLRVELTMRVANGEVRYSRDIRDPQGGGSAGYAETGSGRIEPDGSINLNGEGIGRSFRYTANYSGRLGADGRGTLRGAQDWLFTNEGRVRHRPCTVTIRRE